MRGWASIALLLVGCAHPVPVGPPTLSWDFAARLTTGEVNVLPVLVDVPRTDMVRDTYLGSDLPWFRAESREVRTAQLEAVPGEVGMALPGAVGSALGSSWDATFRAGDWPRGHRDKMQAALRGKAGLDAELAEVARDMGGAATLVVWVDGLLGRPVTADGFPGDIVPTEAGPVVVDHRVEPYRVTARIGLALVASDGEVVVRYADAFDAILTEHSDPARVGRELARCMAREVVRVWPTDPRLAVAEPSQF